MEFVKNNVPLFWVIAVTVGTALLLLIVRGVHGIAVKQLKRRDQDPALAQVINKIIVIYLYIQGVLLISYVFLEKSMYDFITLNLEKIVIVAFAAIFTVVMLAVIRMIFDKLIKKATIEDDRDPTAYKFLKYLSSTVIIILGFIIGSFAFPQLQSLAQTAMAGAGIIAVIVGVASQEAIANVIGGIFIIIYRPFKLGDVLKIRDDMVGHVEDITLRHTVIKNYQNKRIVVPNAIINKEKLINYDMGEKKTCQWIEMGISYDSDIDLAKSIMVDECMKHPNLIDNRDSIEVKNGDPKVIVRVISLGDSSVNLRAWAWAWDYPSAFVLKCEVLESIKKRFDIEGIEIPFPYRTIVMKNTPEHDSNTKDKAHG